MRLRLCGDAAGAARLPAPCPSTFKQRSDGATLQAGRCAVPALVSTRLTGDQGMEWEQLSSDRSHLLTGGAMLVPEEFLYCHQASIWVVTQCNVHQTAKRARFLSWGLQCQPVLWQAGHVRNQSPSTTSKNHALPCSHPAWNPPLPMRAAERSTTVARQATLAIDPSFLPPSL